MSGAAQSIESFDDTEVIELPQGDKPTLSEEDIIKDPSMDTFENNVYQNDEKSKDSQVQLLDEQDGSEKKGGDDEKDKKSDVEDKNDGKKEEGEEKKSTDGEKDKSSEEEKKSEDGKSSETKTSGKPLKVRDGDKLIDISLDATIKTKVKGKNEFVTLQELRDNYSGKKAWTEEIETAKEKTQLAEDKSLKLQDEKNVLIGHLTKIAGMLDKEDGDPLDALYYLLDMTGRDVNTYSKRIFDYMEGQISEMSDMDQTEKDLYWTKKKLDAINNNQAAKAESAKQEQAQRELVVRIDKLRESQGVSEEQYVQAHDELIKLGYKEEDIKPEQVINYGAMLPFFKRAEDFVIPNFEDDLSDDEMDSLITETANVMRKRPQISDEDAFSIAAKMLGFEVETIDDDIDKLNEKVGNDYQQPGKGMKYKENKTPDHIESFDDFDI